MNSRVQIIFIVFCLSFFASCKSTKEVEPKTTSEKIIEKEMDTLSPTIIPKDVQEELKTFEKKESNKYPLNIEEFRAAWVATVANINWPSKSGLSTADQQREALKLLDFLESHNFNAVIFQVRPQADALYESKLEPWSYFLTGKQGKAPDPFYDPLQFWIDAAHDRGIELHVWLNPYRAHHTTGGEVTEESIIKKNPELAVKLANGMWWMDPAKKGTQDHSAAVVMDIVKRYDIDAVHFDDYFYPYDSYNNGKDFPDDESWNSYKNSGGKLSRGDWRRDAVNIFVQRIYKEIKAEKPYVKFGISPFGIWRPGYPQSVQGYDQFDKLYADAKLWLNKGWIDYFTPQLYWQINKYEQSFPELLGWWESENDKNRHLWPGINVGLGGDEKNIDETINQIMISRGMLPQSPGIVHWSIGPLLKNENVAKALVDGPYRKKTLVPSSPWLDDENPESPQVNTSINGEGIQLNWTHPNNEDIFRWVIYFKYKTGGWDYKIINRKLNTYSLQRMVGKNKTPLDRIGITGVDRSGNQSDFKEIIID